MIKIRKGLIIIFMIIPALFSCKSTSETGVTTKKDVFREMAHKLASVDVLLEKKTVAAPGQDIDMKYRTDTPSSYSTGSIILGQLVFSGTESVKIKYSGLPGNQYDWITIVSESAPDSQYGEWFYTYGKASGEYTFKNVPPGRYEVRLYYDWPGGGYAVQGRIKVTVK